MSEFRASRDSRGIVTLTWDVPGTVLNLMSLTGLKDLEREIDAALADPAVKGIILTSAKAGFAGGMDLNVLAGMRDMAGDDPARGVFEGVMAVHRLLRKIERAGMDPKTLKGGIPIVAALPGTAAGIGLELALACHRIIAADAPSARIGLPEIKVGLFPGAGGTTRLVRKLGLMAAAPFLLEGRMEMPARMKAAGVIDEVVAEGDLLARAAEWVLCAGPGDLVKPWDAKGARLPGGAPYTAEGFMTFAGAAALVNGRTQGVYPAAKALLCAAYEGALVPFDTALRIEARWFTQVLLDPTSSAMIRSLFLDRQILDKGLRRPDLPPGLPDESVRRLGVIGAGMMGAGIALAAARAGIAVVLIDATQESADRGRAQSGVLLDRDVQRDRLRASERDAILARITAATDDAMLVNCDLIVEAVFEDPAVKNEVIRRAGAAAPGAILATNTSTLPIATLAQAAGRPQDFIGIHFFSPVDRMALVEIIRGKDTGDRALTKALDFVRQLRKTPIVVNDARFFYANRCIIPYINEGVRMVAEGVPPALVENAARLAGMPVGPLRLIDETSIDLGVRIATATRTALGDAYPDTDVDAVLSAMVEAGRGGRKAGAGFYDYDAQGKRSGLWPGLAGYRASGALAEVDEVVHRLLFIQALEAVRAFEQGVLSDVREGDVGAILGWGFAPWSGGPFSWLDRLGARGAVDLCDMLATRHGARFAPPALLRAMAARGASFRGPDAGAPRKKRSLS